MAEDFIYENHWGYTNAFEFNDIINQQDAAKFVLLILLGLLYMFWATVSPIFRSTLTVYTAFWKKVPTLLSAASRQQTAELVHCSKKLYIQSALEDGRNCRPKHVEQA